MDRFIFTTQTRITAAAAKRINQAIKAICSDAEYIRHEEPGNGCRGWITVPNDGSWDSRAAEIKAMVSAAQTEIATARRPR